MLRGFLSDRSGNFGMMTALLIVPLIGVAGLAVDLTNAMTVKSKLQGAGDAAALAAIASSSPGMQAAFSMNGDGSIPIAESDAKAFFRAQLQNVTGYTIDSIDASIVKSGKTITSVVNFKATVPTYLSKVLGQQIVKVAGRATATYEAATYRSFYLLLDNTPSMGVAATPADIQKMVSKTPDQCAFACHIGYTDQYGNVSNENQNDYYHLAKQQNITTRIDVVAQATQELLQNAIQDRGNNTSLYRMGVYTFGRDATNPQLYEVVSPTTDLSTAATTAKNNVKLMTIPRQNYNNDQITSFDTALAQLGSKMGFAGDGNSVATPQKIVFMVSDGVGDSSKPATCTKPLSGSTRCQEPIDTTACDALKKQGYAIAVLYTTYLPLPTKDSQNNDTWYGLWIAPFQSEIGTRMKACASPGLFFEVSPTQGISDAMTALFRKIVAMPRLTG
ncbi:TadE/TadG family type IV pilus assembly protein [Rhizobium sp. C4]|uniref:TadE/TadG family type IV pilus assembly protein n=1 Tax=Rhizobium sp. C4 TaxID=1349800 RepID=UPI001E31C50A|nr:TadE/TadG family type IV pilus assembly protein [Rhizobium sp. C4]MCD2173910.1 pilus assembly protein [Rhizobium sp. C4]